MNDSTKPADRVFLTSEVERLGIALDNARADVALLRRLKDAEKHAVLIAGELTKAQDKLSEAVANEVTANRQGEFAHLRNLSVTALPSDGRALCALSARYMISFERLSYDTKVRLSIWTPVTINGFNALTSDVMRYLVLHKATVIPAIIMALAPDRPKDAMNAYMIALQRGYMSTPATVQ